jgi:integrase
VLFFTVRADAEQIRAAGEVEVEEIPRLLGRKYNRPSEEIRFILRTTGQDIPLWIFINEEGQPLDHHNFRKRIFEKLLVRAGVRRIRFHDLRHTFASLLLQQRESPQYVKEQMGHHSIQVTVDTYGHLIPGSNRSAVDRLDDATTKPRSRSRKSQPAATPAQLKRAAKIATLVTD